MKHNKNHQWISDEYKTYGCSCEFEGNRTPYTDDQWKAWYTNHKSSDELVSERR